MAVQFAEGLALDARRATDAALAAVGEESPLSLQIAHLRDAQ